jgi:capsular polysaccharide transport system permease protein
MPNDSREIAMDDIVRLVALRATPAESAAPPPRRSPWLLLVLLVVLPTLLSGVYFGYVAAPRYVSEARFNIAKPSAAPAMQSQALSIESGAKGLGVDDSFAVRDYLESRDATRLLIDKADLRHMLQRAAGDPLWDLLGRMSVDTDERLFRTLKRLITVDYDSSTGITTLRVYAFSPVDAQRIANLLLDGSEALVNRLNERVLGDAVRVAEADVARAQAKALAAEDLLTAFRNHWSVIDPTALSQTVIGAISALTLQVVDVSAELNVLINSQPHSPQIAPMTARLNALQLQIKVERSRLAGGAGSFAPQVADYETLLLKRDFAAKSFVSTLTVLEAVRLDAERQQAYVTRIVTPRMPDEPDYPRPVQYTAIIFLAGLALFWLFKPERQR